jgi:hypothetical protein
VDRRIEAGETVMRLPPANGAGCTVFAIAVELTGEDPMKRVVLVSLFLMLSPTRASIRTAGGRSSAT